MGGASKSHYKEHVRWELFFWSYLETIHHMDAMTELLSGLGLGNSFYIPLYLGLKHYRSKVLHYVGVQ